jgi:hypothetical protein
MGGQNLNDPTEDVRRKLAASLNSEPKTREELEAEFGKDDVFDTRELAQNFIVTGFGAPLVVVRRKHDNALGSLFFQNAPRLYFGFKKD